MPGFDTELSAIEQRHAWALSPRTLNFPKDKEYEIKYEALQGLRTLSHILSHLPVLEFERKINRLVPKAEVFLIEPEYHYKDYHLANFGLDTVDEHGDAAFGIHGNGFQLRQRMSVRHYLPASDPDSIGISQCSVKNLFSIDRDTKRIEVEENFSNMHHAAEQFLRATKKRLPACFANVAADRLHVSTAFMSSRGFYLLGVYLPQEGAIVAFDVSNDQTMHLTPDLNHITGRDHEWELEAKRVFFLRERKIFAFDEEHEATRLFGAAEHALREYVQRRFQGHLLPFVNSKYERSLHSAHEYYNHQTNGKPFDYTRVSGKFLHVVGAQKHMPPIGAYHALAHNVSMAYIERARTSRLRELAEREMVRSSDLVHVPGVTKKLFCARDAEKPALRA